MNKRLLVLLHILVLASMMLAACATPPARLSSPHEEPAGDLLPTIDLGIEIPTKPTSDSLLPELVLVVPIPTPDWVEAGVTLTRVELRNGEYFLVEGSETTSKKEGFSSRGWNIPVKNHGSCEALVDIYLQVWIFSTCVEEK